MFLNLVKFLLGIILGISLLLGASAGVAYYFLNRLTVSPSKPIFAEEKPKPGNKKSAASQKDGLKPGTYKAKVTWSKGVRLREKPEQDAERVGSVGHEQEVIVLATSDDKEWLQVQVPDADLKGWTRATNVEKIDPSKQQAEKNN
ncbi:MAG: SH3 domain-containing protein [Cyanosarcina radialis HA8281-LM2]|jgi:hypothetical protein|nr:SH3 domain-containing protein [Cyanosarcina radialis HA8281-LM2]